MRSAEELAAAWSVLLADIDHAIEAQRGRSAGGQQVTGPRLSYAPLSVLHEVQRQCRWALEGQTDYLAAYRDEARREALEEVMDHLRCIRDDAPYHVCNCSCADVRALAGKS